MNKSLAFIVACMAFLTGFAADPLAGLTKFYWNKPDGGNWNTAANWVMADGSTATTYPQTATDAAIFNGTNPGKSVTIPKNFTNIVGSVYLEDGLTGFKFASSTASIRFHVIRLLHEDHATMSFASDGYNWKDPADCVIDNRDEILVDECIPGSSWRKDDGDWNNLYSATLDAESSKLKHAGDVYTQAYSVTSSMTWDKKYSLRFGSDGSGRNITFSGDYVLTIPSGQLIPASDSHVGSPNSAYQGTIASSKVVYYWSRSSVSKFRPVVAAPKFVQASRYTTLYYDDHSNEACAYYIPHGTLQLGDSAATDLTATCKLGEGDVNVSWSGTLSVQCAGALEKVGAIRMTSYRGQGTTWGKISMGVSDAVASMTLDGQPLAAGTYGATGSGAETIDDDHFSGTGVLTVLGGSPATSSGVVIIVQ